MDRFQRAVLQFLMKIVRCFVVLNLSVVDDVGVEYLDSETSRSKIGSI